MIDISVVIPSYNEERNARSGVLDQVINYLKAQSYSFEVILADDGSTDRTPEILSKFAERHAKHVRFLPLPHRGKGPTVVDGLLHATGKWRLFTDFDQATPIEEIEKLLPFTEKGYDVVIGSREITGAKRNKEPFHRHLMGRVFNTIVQIVAIRGIQDTQCGFKLFSGKSVEDLCPRLVVYAGKTTRGDAFTGAFDVELLFLAKRYGYLIAEVPVMWHHVKTDRVDPIKDSLRMFLDLLRLRLAAYTGQYAHKEG